VRGGPRANAGRKLGVPDPHHTPEATRALLDAHRHPGESWAGLARRIGVNRRSVSRAIVNGGTVRQVSAWLVRLLAAPEP